ncbi:tumor necrosis factor receptor superfamily member 14-like [Nematolebias whitei]|uniref:tumor necrosis factor receptor superfamily member 14-like n=1 Tax=Nematolebias whitei TaxID=451745 RepID=UPI0018986F0A|nr:tumor necrosis factor receptor superfamily member 14-like [Nematolebias whitei]
MQLGVVVVVVVVVMLVLGVVCVRTLMCDEAEYQTGAQCCPLCGPGMRVEKDCTDFTSTACVSCTDGTYMDKHNGQKECKTCSRCEPGSGLEVNQSCALTSDTVCKPLEGFFCTNFSSSSCSAAQRHSSCTPGRYMSHTGTSFSDAECSDCSSGTFSDGTSTTCQPHTRCEAQNLRLIKAGTASADAECGEKGSNLGGIVVNAVLFLGLFSVTLFFSYCAITGR